MIIHAVADGQRAARAIGANFRGSSPRLERRGYFTPISRTVYDTSGPLPNYLHKLRQQPQSLPVDRRVGVSLVEIGFDEVSALDQASRCLICSLNPIFDSDLCILCNGCVDVCPMDCLKLVPAGELEGDPSLETVLEAAGSSEATAMLLDPTLCIRCGLCALRCPTEAVVMNSFQFIEQLEFEEAA